MLKDNVTETKLTDLCLWVWVPCAKKWLQITHMFSYGRTDMGIGWKFIITLREFSFICYLITFSIRTTAQWRYFISSFLFLSSKTERWHKLSFKVMYKSFIVGLLPLIMIKYMLDEAKEIQRITIFINRLQKTHSLISFHYQIWCFWLGIWT